MLDNETKRKIDGARNILVGKVPDPKAQVEQITTALIYKFMDDMDREAESFGGKAKFITAELEEFKWANLMSKSIGGSERLNLYMSALLEFAKSSHIPEIFRTIFKDAFLPYRDPETLNLFLKEIDYFDYDHSENLGNAFEYLLSILGSQGDAGQFRTPRHIIDFIVEILEPKKDETILDPACGTAGFLISAYKHIIANNSKITPDEKKALVNHFTGYDISPDMVRLSLVNMYLHSFPTPKIYEYDTLTSEDRWNDSFDVILANPPFMTPKGGIRPHNRFSVQANRSEVLFVDYIAEHLSLNGRAGIIIPEGIIFQSANAYKALRKMLLENGFLWAVVSLPAGVFQPYSGVKTSILLLDRNIAKNKEDILFIKISNDGYDLGAQRREINKNDLPEALEILKNYRLGSGTLVPQENSEAKALLPNIFQIVPKTKIAESGDYNLTGDRYRENTRAVQTAYPMVKLGEVCDILNGYAFESSQYVDNGARVIRITNVQKGKIVDEQPRFYGVSDEFKKFFLCENDILLSLTGNVGRVGRMPNNLLPAYLNQRVAKLTSMSDRLSNNYLFTILNNNHFEEDAIDSASGIAQKNMSTNWLKEYFIPLPAIEIQNQIVAQIEEWQKIIDGAKQVINSYRPIINIDPSWEMVKLGDVCEINPEQKEPSALFGDDEFIYIDISSVENGTGKVTYNNIIKTSEAPSRARRVLKEEDILLSTVRPNLKAFCILKGLPKNCLASTGFAVLRVQNQINASFLFNLIFDDSVLNQMIGIMGKGAYPSINSSDVENLRIPLPPLEIQNQIVEQIEKERKAVESCKSLVDIFEAKIKAKIDEVWGKSADE